MAYVPGFTNDIFISYSHLDDRAVDRAGWVSDFHQRLQIEVEEELGARVQIWRDARIGPADDFGRDLDRQVRGSAMLVAILSPGYMNSSWCDWELTGFARGTRRVGDLFIDTKCRAIKIIKRPADLSRLRVLSETGVLEFFDTDQASGRTYEIDGGSERFNRRLTLLGQEIGTVLRTMRNARSVFLGTATTTLAPERERVRQELDARGYRILQPPTDPADDAPTHVRAAIGGSSLSVLFHDRSVQPASNAAEAVATGERDAAAQERARHIVVVRGEPGITPQSWRELAGIERGSSNVEWLIDPPPHTLVHTVLQMLGTPVEPPPPEPPPTPPESRPQRLVRVYLICDRHDHPLLQSNRARNLRDHLLGLGFEVKLPLAEDADAAEFSRDNRTKLRQCDAVLLYWGTARQGWFDQRLGELLQARGWRRGREFVASGAYVGDPRSPIKQNYETREVDELIKQFETFDLSDAKLVRCFQRLAHAV